MIDPVADPTTPVTLHLDYACATDTGRARGNNEDAIRLDAARGLAVLADGMGGYNAGEVASDMAVATMHRLLGPWIEQADLPLDDASVRRVLAGAAQQANHQVFEAANNHAAYAGMGTTLVAALFSEQRFWVGHIGDSRAYRLRAGHMEQLSRDHSLLQEQIDAGLLTPEEASVALHRNLVTRAVGVEPHVELEVHQFDLQGDDLVLLCSDGLTDMLPDVVIAQILRTHEALDATAQALIDAANAAGGRDNIAVILIRAKGGLPRTGRAWWPFRR